MSFCTATGRIRSSTNAAYGLLEQALFACKLEVQSAKLVGWTISPRLARRRARSRPDHGGRLQLVVGRPAHDHLAVAARSRSTPGPVAGDSLRPPGLALGVPGWHRWVGVLRRRRYGFAPLSLVPGRSRPAGSRCLPCSPSVRGQPLPRREWFGSAGGATDSSSFRSHSRAARAEAAPARGSPLSPGSSPRSSPSASRSVRQLPSCSRRRVRHRRRSHLRRRRRRDKEAVDGGVLLLFALPVLACHGLAFTLIQLSFQRGRALATAGLSLVLHECPPDRRRAPDLRRERAARAARRLPFRRLRLCRPRRGRRRSPRTGPRGRLDEPSSQPAELPIRSPATE